MKLEKNHEVVGTLSGIETNEHHMKLEFTLHKDYEIPIGALSEEKLRAMIGERIGIFNSNGDYRVRRANKRK